ncbi:MAG: hypothetical protein JSS21_05735 [Proteobacteria bacterium]|nr:hypothetical protein [Pseudomonadota bacterium]
MKSILRVLMMCATCLVLAACATTTAEMLARPGGVYGPSAGPDFGLVRYLADGSAADVDARQQDANRMIYDACSGHYRILSKGSRSELQLEPGGRFGRTVTANDENYIYIKFVCTRL